MVVSERDFQVVLVQLVLPPGLFPLLLLQRKHLVIGLKLLKGLVTFGSVLVLQHATHASKSLSLLCVRLLFLTLSFACETSLTHLLICPVLLVLSVDHHALLVH